MSKIKVQSKKITYPAGTSGILTENIQLDSNYTECIGISVIDSTVGQSFKLGFEDNSEIYHSPVGKQLWIFDASVPPNERFTDTTIPLLHGQQLMIRTVFDAVSVADVEFEVLFKLKR